MPTTFTKNLIGETFDRLTVVGYDKRRRGHGYSAWICVCACGNKNVKAATQHLKKPHVSCGCYMRELTINRNRARRIHSPEAVTLNAIVTYRIKGLIRSSATVLGSAKRSFKISQIGWTYKDLRRHLQSKCLEPMVFDDPDTWTIDHVFPFCAFVDYGIRDLVLINRPDNIQLLPPSLNYAKQGWYDPPTFENWLIKEGVSSPARQRIPKSGAGRAANKKAPLGSRVIDAN